MATNMQHGYLVLADISGYTSYLAASELEHAHDILSELLELIVGHFSSLLTIVKLEGDAVFAHVPEPRLSRGETLLELMESTYVAFKDRATAMSRRTTCQCKACRAIPSLDLKFLAHHGNYVVQQVTRIQELVGSDVNLVHRLLKNGIGESTGWRAYALFTEAALEHMGCWPVEMHRQVESYEHLGEVATYSLNLQARYREIVDARRVVIAPEDADVVMSYDFPAPAPLVWAWLNDPIKRVENAPAPLHWKAAARPGGRTGAGARNHCEHGKGAVTVEQVLDWRPFDYFTVEYVEPPLRMTQTTRLEPIPGGTRIHFTLQMHVPIPRPLRRLFFNLTAAGMFRGTWQNMERQMRREEGTPAAVPVLA